MYVYKTVIDKLILKFYNIKKEKYQKLFNLKKALGSLEC